MKKIALLFFFEENFVANLKFATKFLEKGRIRLKVKG
jgi:hypothetical protein